MVECAQDKYGLMRGCGSSSALAMELLWYWVIEMWMYQRVSIFKITTPDRGPISPSRLLKSSLRHLLHNNETWYIFAYSGYLMSVIILVLSYCVWLLYICMCFNKPFRIWIWIWIEWNRILSIQRPPNQKPVPHIGLGYTIFQAQFWSYKCTRKRNITQEQHTTEIQSNLLWLIGAISSLWTSLIKLVSHAYLCHQDFTTPFFIWMLAAVWWHCGQGLMRVLLDSDWSTPDQVSSEILKTDSSSFLLNPQPMQTCAMIVPRLMATCLWPIYVTNNCCYYYR